MPELPDEMYCSQQIIVPPTFPYLLRQYAKAAIRSQPTDLLRWSTAYFRCLSLNLPPPVKPRLEYPIPKDYDGITPGWLRALLYQFLGTTHVDFKVLWDRWMGACLNHKTLIKILCLGGFTEPHAVPFYKFIALCAAFLSENLTQTMMLICEILTDEPEGGSASITCEIFNDLYAFLAVIDGSKGQIIINKYFTDDLLNLVEKQKEKQKDLKAAPPKSPSKQSTESQVTLEEEELGDDGPKDAISCPDLQELENVEGKSNESGGSASLSENKPDEVAEYLKEQEGEGGEGEQLFQDDYTDRESVSTIVSDKLRQTLSEKFLEPQEVEVNQEGPKEIAMDSEENVRDKNEFIEERVDDQDEGVVPEETQSEVTREEGGSTLYDMLAEGKSDLEPEEIGEEEMKIPSEGTIEDVAEEESEKKSEQSLSKFEEEEIYVEAVPGIGPAVPKELVETVLEYMKMTAGIQHGMVMPRNIRHYSCPPLEVFD